MKNDKKPYNYKGKYSQHWERRFGMLPHLPTSYDNSNSIYELLAWLQRGFKCLIDDFANLELEFEQFKECIIELLKELIPNLIRDFANSEEFKQIILTIVWDWYEEHIEPIINAIHNRLNLIENRLELIENRLELIENRLDKIETDITDIKDEILTIKIILSNINERIDNIDLKIINIEEKINDIKNSILNLNDKVDNNYIDLIDRYTQLNTKYDELNTKYNSLESTVNNLNANNAKLNKIIQHLTSIGVWENNDFKSGMGVAGGNINLFGGTQDGNSFIRTSSANKENDITAGI